MTERFVLDLENGFLIDTKNELDSMGFNERTDFKELHSFLNKQDKEIKELKETLKRMMVEMMRWSD